MAEKSKTLLEGGAGDALGEGAARFERVIEGVKRQHAVAPEPPAHIIDANPLLSASPGEQWARRFQSQGIGPVPGLSASEPPPVPRAMIMPAMTTESLNPPGTADIAPKITVGGPDIRFGRADKPRRSWLGRMFSRG